MKARIIFIALITFLNFINFEILKENKFNDIKELVKKYYSDFVTKNKSNQEFMIKEFIIKVRNGLYMESFVNVAVIKLVNFENCGIKENSWIFEKLSFISTGMLGAPSENIFSPEPRIPRDFYKQKTGIDLNTREKVLYLKLRCFNHKISGYIQPLNSASDFKFCIELYLTNVEKYEDNIFEDSIAFKIIFYKIFFIQDLSPRNTFEREIKIYGSLESLE